MLRRSLGLALVLAALAAGCGDSTAPVASDEERFAPLVEAFNLSAAGELPYPQYNQLNPARIALGRLLFYDPILGGESAPWVKRAAGKDPYRYRGTDMACGTCHQPALAFGDDRRVSSGVGGDPDNQGALGKDRTLPGVSLVTGQPVGSVPRNALTLLNVSHNGRGSAEPTNESFQFMDGSVTLGLEVQAQKPLLDRDEMAGDAYGREILGDALTDDDVHDSVTARVRDIPGYLPLFQAAYPDEVTTPGSIQLFHITKALAAYMRELVTRGSSYDRFVEGDWSAFDEQEKQGFELFFGKGLCGDCHHGPMLSDYSFHVTGVGDDYDAIAPGFAGKSGDGADYGRYHAVPQPEHKYTFRTLTIREVARTGPYFHSGSAATLRDVVEFHNRGGLGEQDLSPATLAAAGVERSPSVVPLGLSGGEISALVAFLSTTVGQLAPGPPGADLRTVPERVPSGLIPPGIASPPGDGPYLPE